MREIVPLEAERALLGSWMTDRDAWDASSDLYIPGMFGGPWHNLIAEEVARAAEAGRPADPVTIAMRIPRGEDEETNPTAYVMGLARGIGSASGARHWAEIVRERWALREARRVMAEAMEDDESDAPRVVERVQRSLAAIEVGDAGEIRTMAQDVPEFMDALEAERDQRPGTEVRATGFTVIDQITGGLETGIPHIMAARPGGGKSAYATALARYSAGVLKEPTALIWIEDTRRKAMLRLAASEAGVPGAALRHGRSLDTDAFDRVAAAMNRVMDWPLYIESAKGMTPRQIAARMRRLAREKGVRRFLCDHLGEMNLGEEGDAKTTKLLGDALRTYRDVLENTGSGGVMFHQLGREAERGDTPSIAWLYNSDQVGQVARVVGFLAPEGKTMRVHFPKVTYGPPNVTVELGWEPVTMTVFQPRALL